MSAPPEILHFASPLGRSLDQLCWDHPLLLLLIPVLFLWNVAWRHGEAPVSPGHGADKSRTKAVLWSQTPADPARYSTSARSSHVESSPASEQQCAMTQTIYPPLLSIVLGSETGRINQRKWPPSCICPRGCVDVT